MRFATHRSILSPGLHTNLSSPHRLSLTSPLSSLPSHLRLPSNTFRCHIIICAKTHRYFEITRKASSNSWRTPSSVPLPFLVPNVILSRDLQPTRRPAFIVFTSYGSLKSKVSLPSASFHDDHSRTPSHNGIAQLARKLCRWLSSIPTKTFYMSL